MGQEQVTEIYLGFASSRLHEKGGELCYDMWPALGTQMMFPMRGAVAGKKVIRNTDQELTLAKGLLQYKFRFSPQEAGPDALKYSVSFIGTIPLGVCWGDISGDGKRVLRAAFDDLIE